MSADEKYDASQREVKAGIHALRNGMLDTIYRFSFIAAIVAAVVSVARVSVSGYKTIFTIDLIGTAVLGGLIATGRRVHYRVRLGILILFLMCGGTMGLAGFGMFGYGILLFLVATVLTAAFANRKAAFLVLFLSAGIVAVIGGLFSSEKLVLAFDMVAYHRSVVSWVNMETGLVAIGSVIVLIVTALVSRITRELIRSQSSLREVRLLNETLEQKVAERTAALEQSNRHKDKILGVVAHDINNKLGGIVGYLDLLDEERDHLTDEQRQFIGKSLDASMFAKDIVQELLEFARGEGDSTPLVRETVEINSFVVSSVECHVPRALEKKITLHMNESGRSLYCEINKTGFSRVIDNLITNAIKFTSEGGTVEVGVTATEESVMIEVKDNGIGIPDSLRPNLFVPFSASGRPGTAQEKSTGLGLAISKGIVERHSGKIWFDSTPGEGTSFYISLPKAVNAAVDRGSI